VTIEVSHGKPRPRPARLDRPPTTDLAGLAGPVRNPEDGRFVAGNPGGRLRQFRALARAESESLLRLTTDQVAPWLRGHLADAQDHAQRLIDALPVQDEELLGLCADEARARLMSRAALAEGCRDGADPEIAREWRKESREWSREARQIFLTRKAALRDVDPDDRSPHAVPWLESPANGGAK
jgi:hypothetical protein